MIKINFILFVMALLFTLSFKATAIEFSADVLQTAPNRPNYHAKMFRSNESVRMEYFHNNQYRIEIINQNERRATLLLPSRKSYIILKSIPKPTQTTSNEQNNKSPCFKSSNSKCKLLNHEKISDRKTEKWQITETKKNGEDIVSLHWIDEERRIPLKEFWPDGSISEIKIEGTEMLDGRKTEKWLYMLTSPEGNVYHSYQWYDIELNLTTKEIRPGGYLRQLTNITINKLDDQLFKVPSDYNRLYVPVRKPTYPNVNVNNHVMTNDQSL